VVAGLQVDGAVVRYGPLTAVDRVSLQVAPGEVLAVIGASGSGKSSLLRAVAGLEPLAEGRVSWDGADLAEVPVHKRGFAVMFQDGQLFPHLSVGGNVGYALYREPKAVRAQRVGELLDLVGLAGYAARPVTALSGGQAQRVALARSLAANPRLLMLDEPLSALDSGLRERMVEVLATGLRATHTTAVYVTHDQDEAFTIADRVAVLSGGRLLQVAEPAELWRRPAGLEVAQFLGYRPILSPGEVAALAWPGPLPTSMVALGPDALQVDDAGVELTVGAVTFGRGETTLELVLPSGHAASLRLKGVTERPSRISVRIDPEGCALLDQR
jgi:thiamine transport system ATP-binding protein